MISKKFKEWATSLSGCDGGNENAETWICGIEWGGGSYENGVYYKEHLSKEIALGAVSCNSKKFDWKDSITYPYGRSFAKLYSAIKGSATSEYKNLVNNIWDGSEIFKLNLYPIAFDSTSHTLWQDNNLKELIGFEEKELYQLWCATYRFPAILEHRKNKKPKLIICTGISYLRSFLQCFAGDQMDDNFVQKDEIHVETGDKTSQKRSYYWAKVDGGTLLVIIPFLSGIHGLNSDLLLQEMGNSIRKHLMRRLN